MCQIWRKEYTCGCISHPYRDRCTACLRSKDDKCDNMDWIADCRKSFFACYDCLVEQDRQEKEAAKDAASRRVELKQSEADQLRRDAERERQTKIRREAEARAAKEREDDKLREAALKAEREMSKKDGGVWAEVAGGKRGKKGKNGVNGTGAAKGGVSARNGTAGSNSYAHLPAAAPQTSTSFAQSGSSLYAHSVGGHMNGTREITIAVRDKDAGGLKSNGDSPKNGNGRTEQRKGKGNSSPNNRNGNGNGSPLHKINGIAAKNDDSKGNDKVNGLPEKPNGLPEKPDFVDKKGVDPGGRAGTWGPKKSGSRLEKPTGLRKGVV